MTLEISGIEVDCVIGERPDERTRLQRIRVDAMLETDGKAALTDELADAVDYVTLAEAIRKALVEAKCKLIERAAEIAVSEAMKFAPVQAAQVRVTKSGAVPGICSASATARKENGKCGQRKHWWPF